MLQSQTPATRIMLKGSSLFLLSSSPPPFQTCSSAAYFVPTLICARSLCVCETLSHAKVAEKNPRKWYDFFSYLLIKVICKGPDRCQSGSKKGGKAAEMRRREKGITVSIGKGEWNCEIQDLENVPPQRWTEVLPDHASLWESKFLYPKQSAHSQQKD